MVLAVQVYIQVYLVACLHIELVENTLFKMKVRALHNIIFPYSVIINVRAEGTDSGSGRSRNMS